MGVSCNYYAPMGINKSRLIHAVARAAGDQRALNEDNYFTVERLVSSRTEMVSGQFIDLENGSSISVHLSESFPLGPCWIFSAGSSSRTAAIFNAVAEEFGGVVVYDDSIDNARLFHGRPHDIDNAEHELMNTRVGRIEPVEAGTRVDGVAYPNFTQGDL